MIINQKNNKIKFSYCFIGYKQLEMNGFEQRYLQHKRVN